MARILIMPRQGNTVESCIITDWKVREGDAVGVDTVMCEVETDKAVFEVPAGADGMVLKILHEAGDDVPVLSPIAVIGEAGEDWQKALSEAAGDRAGEVAIPVPQSPTPAPQLPIPIPAGSPSPIHAISPRARNLAEKNALSPESVPGHGSGPGGRIIERDIMAALQNRPGLSAAARATAAVASGVGTLPAEGSGLGGRITVADIAANAGQLLSAPGAFTVTPMRGVRKIISDRMHRSLAQSAQFTLNASAPARRLQDVRSWMKAENSEYANVTINDLLLFAVSRTIPEFPSMNAHMEGDTVKTFERLHLGFAVDTPKGLMVPVIRDAHRLSPVQISSEAKRLAAACQNGSVTADELSGSTFTVTNLGSMGVTSFTPILNFPEVAILGICGIELKPVAIDGNVCFEPHIGLSLTINHQVVDGAPAARFLKALCDTIAGIDKEKICTIQ